MYICSFFNVVLVIRVSSLALPKEFHIYGCSSCDFNQAKQLLIVYISLYHSFFSMLWHASAHPRQGVVLSFIMFGRAVSAVGLQHFRCLITLDTCSKNFLQCLSVNNQCYLCDLGVVKYIHCGTCTSRYSKLMDGWWS